MISRCLSIWGKANRSRRMKLRSAFIFACAGLAILISGCLPVSAATRHVVLLFDERVELPGLVATGGGTGPHPSVQFHEPIEVYRESMDLSRFGSSSYKSLLRDFLRAKYADKKIDVAVAVMAPCL